MRSWAFHADDKKPLENISRQPSLSDILAGSLLCSLSPTLGLHVLLHCTCGQHNQHLNLKTFLSFHFLGLHSSEFVFIHIYCASEIWSSSNSECSTLPSFLVLHSLALTVLASQDFWYLGVPSPSSCPLSRLTLSMSLCVCVKKGRVRWRNGWMKGEVFKELAHSVMEADKSKVCRVGWQAGDPWKIWCCGSDPKAGHWQNSFQLREGQSFVLLRPSTDGMSTLPFGGQSAILSPLI